MTEVERRGKPLHTVPNYVECDNYLGTPCGGLLFVVDEVRGWREAGGVRVFEFDHQVVTTVQRKDGESFESSSTTRAFDQNDDEDGGGHHRMMGTWAREWRASVWVDPQSPANFTTSVGPSLGDWMNTIYRMGLLRQDYEALISWEE